MQLHTDKFEKMTANSRSPLGSKAAYTLWNQEFAAFAMRMKKLTLLNGNQPTSLFLHGVNLDLVL